MGVIVVPYHLDERLERFDLDAAIGTEMDPVLPAADLWARLTAIYDPVARAVCKDHDRPVVVSGDCTTSWGTLTGLQRRGLDPGIVWIDAHGDLQTESTTSSGYIGGMALAALMGEQQRPISSLGLRPVAASRIMLLSARDLEPAEKQILSRSPIRRGVLGSVDPELLPTGPVYLHVDVDVCDPLEIGDLLYPATGGVSFSDLLAAVSELVVFAEVTAVGIAATWTHGTPRAVEHRRRLACLLDAAA